MDAQYRNVLLYILFAGTMLVSVPCSSPAAISVEELARFLGEERTRWNRTVDITQRK
jgi:hypothetical protein